MIASRHPDPLPADPRGQRLCQIFGAYRWKFIQAPRPDAGAKVAWQTVKTYPLRPRVLWNQWQDAHTLIGVRFGHDTTYALLDIDAGSPYCSAAGIADIRAALETIGLSRTLLLQSSWSGGLHLYIPLPEAVNTFNLAVALQGCLQAQGLGLGSGQLETFPNVKAYGVKAFIEYNAHRLPLQPASGSVLLDDALNPIGHSLDRFLWLWDGAADQQDLATLHQACTLARDNHRKRPRRRTNPVDSWRYDLETDIGEGWTGSGQTNHLLKTIACYGRVFEQLDGAALEDYTLRVATASPGYRQHCRHQHEIRRRCQAWARSVEHYYWPLGTLPRRRAASPTPPVTFNQQQAESAQQRIRQVCVDLAQQAALPEQITARAQAIAHQARVSQQTLYKPQNLPLWHPHHQGEIDGVMGNTAVAPSIQREATEPCKPSQDKLLHPQLQNMKGGTAPVADPSPDLPSFSERRGVRGDVSQFPQESDTPSDSSCPDALLGAALDDLTPLIQQQVRRLQWSFEQVQGFIGARFAGRRRWQLSQDDLLLLLYYLRDELAPG